MPCLQERRDGIRWNFFTAKLFSHFCFVYIKFRMKYKALLLFFSLIFAACESFEDSYIYQIDETEKEVLLTDLNGLQFSLSCRVRSGVKKCGVVFNGFVPKSQDRNCTPNSCTYTTTLFGFLDASLLTLQVEDENTHEVQSIIAYFQDDSTYMKGSVYVPSSMNQRQRKNVGREITLNGYYEGDRWINLDTTIAIMDTIFANDEGKIRFNVSDSKGNRARFAMDLGEVLKNYGSRDSEICYVGSNSYDGPRSTVPRNCWIVNSSEVVVEPEELNFEFGGKNNFIDMSGTSCISADDSVPTCRIELR